MHRRHAGWLLAVRPRTGRFPYFLILRAKPRSECCRVQTHRYFATLNWTSILQRSAPAPIVPEDIVRDETDVFDLNYRHDFGSVADWETYVPAECCNCSGKPKEPATMAVHWHDDFDVKGNNAAAQTQLSSACRKKSSRSSTLSNWSMLQPGH